MRHSAYKTRGGLIRVSLEADEKINDILITGDFFIYPEESVEELEKSLLGVSVEEEKILDVVNDFFENIDAMDIEPKDFVAAIKKAL